MQLTRAADYAVSIMIRLAGLPPGTRIQASALADAAGVPETFLAKVLQSLTRAGLLASRRGPEGGFEMLPASPSATIFDVITAVDGPLHLNLCLANGDACQHHGWCPAHDVWAEAQEAMIRVLKSKTLAELAALAKDRRGAIQSLDRIAEFSSQR